MTKQELITNIPASYTELAAKIIAIQATDADLALIQVNLHKLDSWFTNHPFIKNLTYGELKTAINLACND